MATKEMQSTINRLNLLESARGQLQREIKNFEDVPEYLEAVINSDKLEFGLDQMTGQVATVPKGVWGWAIGFKWRDFSKMLKKEGYEVRPVMAQ